MANTQIRTVNEKRTERKRLYGGYYLTQRAQRTRSFNSPAVNADAGDVASFTTTGERKGGMANEHSIQLLIYANLCVLLSRGASDHSSDSVNNKIFATFASSACENKTSVW